jgi:hypothetical protein
LVVTRVAASGHFLPFQREEALKGRFNRPFFLLAKAKNEKPGHPG